MTDQRPDRIVFLSHTDYVELLDHHPRVLKDNRVTVVPFPLMGRWVADKEVVAAAPAPNAVLLRDANDGKLAHAEPALRALALSRVYAFIEVCQLLGATSLRTAELDESTSKSRTSNKFTAGVTSALTRGPSERSAGADFAAEIQREVRSSIEAVGTFAGSAPDVEAARAVAARYEDLSRALASLIALRSTQANTLRTLEVRVDFLSAAHREVDVLLEFGQSLDLALGKHSAQIWAAHLRNDFQHRSDSARRQTMSIEVSFPER